MEGIAPWLLGRGGAQGMAARGSCREDRRPGRWPMGEVGHIEQRAGRPGSRTRAGARLGRCDWIEAGRRCCINGLTEKMRDGGDDR
jgi:hypothetical protein